MPPQKKSLTLKGKTLKRIITTTLVDRGRLVVRGILVGLAFMGTADANILGFMPYKACFDEASRAYGVPEKLLIAIAKVESDFNPRAITHDSNGTTDYGLMQINTANIQDLGLNQQRLLYDPCYNIYAGAVVLKQCVNQYGFGWRAVSCYNAGHYWNPHYVMKVANALEKLNLYAFSNSLISAPYRFASGYNNGKFTPTSMPRQIGNTNVVSNVNNNGYFTTIRAN